MLEHGGRLAEASARFSPPAEGWLDLSTGINPHGYPIPPIPAAAWQRLPEEGDGLEAAAAAYYGTPHLLPVAGSQAAIQALPGLFPPGRVLTLAPTYAEHPHAWRGHAATALPAETLNQAVETADTLVLVNPNNPDGGQISRERLVAWHSQLARRGGRLIVDEAFADGAPEDSLAPLAGQPGLVVLRSLGKFFGLAGARVGFVLAEPALLARLAQRLGPWTVAGPARVVAAAALADRAWQATTRARLIADSQRLARLLAHHGLAPAAGTALFQWVPHPKAEALRDALARLGIWLRLFQAPPGLRFGLPGSSSEWARLDAALATIPPSLRA
ncbi:MAG: threonine-phosphate decarboxylase CobD [Rhodocyclaceae bacterium]|jgi:cobalamin biosynthetic protein CobC|nr:threonine-phosphate decarboxylase CobD [Rhodocyclaceae bacterium]